MSEWATVTASGGDHDNSSVRQFVDVQEPRCQNSVDLPDFNKLDVTY
jgi:hypothetical protein